MKSKKEKAFKMLAFSNMRLFPILFLFVSSNLSCQNGYLSITCKQDSLLESSTYVNDLCTISYNFILEKSRGSLDGVLVWSNADWFFSNLFAGFNKQAIDSLSLDEKRELLELLGGLTQSFVEGKNQYLKDEDNGHSSSLKFEEEGGEIEVYVEGDLACAVMGNNIVFLQMDKDSLWKAFRAERKTSDFKVHFIRNPD